MKPEIEYVYNKLKKLRFDFNSMDFREFRSKYRYDPALDRYVRKDDNDLFIAKDTFKPLEEELEYADKCHNLEEQIGCPLEVVAHLVMNKPFYYEDGYGRMHFIQGYELCTCSLLFGNTWEDVDIYLGEDGSIEIPLSDYKKTFWLKRDKSE